MSAQTDAAAERRKHANLREIFDAAYRVAYPLLSVRDDMGAGHMGSSMLQLALHEAFPTLHKQDIPILVSALRRVHLEQSKASAS